MQPKPNNHGLTPEIQRSLVERRIQEAMERGEFDNLPGAGKPIHIDEPPVLNSDLWWALKILKQAGFVPDEVRWRKQIDELRARMHDAGTEEDLRQIVCQMNELIMKLNTMGANKIPTTLTTFDEEKIVRGRNGDVSHYGGGMGTFLIMASAADCGGRGKHERRVGALVPARSVLGYRHPCLRHCR